MHYIYVNNLKNISIYTWSKVFDNTLGYNDDTRGEEVKMYDQIRIKKDDETVIISDKTVELQDKIITFCDVDNIEFPKTSEPEIVVVDLHHVNQTLRSRFLQWRLSAYFNKVQRLEEYLHFYHKEGIKCYKEVRVEEMTQYSNKFFTTRKKIDRILKKIERIKGRLNKVNS